MRKLIFLLVVFVIANAKVFADDKVSFTAAAPDVVVVGDQFRLSYTVNTQKIKDFRVPSIKGFDVLMGPTRSSFSNTQIVNGKMSSEKGITFTYILMATSEGDFTIPGATIVADGGQAVSNSVKIRVLPPDQDANSAAAQSTNRRSSTSSNTSRATSSASVSNEDVFVTANVSRATVYEQEAFLLTYKIYTRESRMGLENVKLPDFTGFHSQEIERPSNSTWSQEHYKGRNYYTTIYRQFVLFPRQSGKLTIEPARFDAAIEKVVQSADP